MGILFFSRTILTLRVNSWFGVWVGIEIMILTLIPLMVSTNNSVNNESAIKYFLIQVLSGLLYLESIMRSVTLD